MQHRASLRLQIYTAARDGCIMLWQYETVEVKAVWRVAYAIESMVVPSRHSAVLSVQWRASGIGRIIVLDLDRAAEAAEAAEPADAAGSASVEAPGAVEAPGERRVCKLQGASLLTLSCDRNYVAAVDGQRVVVVCLQQQCALLTMVHTRGLTVRSACS